MTGGFDINDDPPQAVRGGDDTPLVSVPEADATPAPEPPPQPQPAAAAQDTVNQIAQMIASAVDTKLDQMMPEIRQTITEATLKFATDQSNQRQQQSVNGHAAQVQVEAVAAAPAPAAPGVGGISEIVGVIPHLVSALVEAKALMSAGNVSANPLGALKQISEENPMLLSLYSPSPWGERTQDMWMLSYKAGLQTKINGMAAAGEMTKKAQADIQGYLVKDLPGSGRPAPERPSATPVPLPVGEPANIDSVLAGMFD